MNRSSRPVAVVTGASAGIGKATARMLCERGWRVIGCGRDPDRTAQAEEEIRASAADGGLIEFVRADFSEMKEVKRTAQDIAERTDRIDVLINNAGGVRDKLYMTGDGMDATFAVNHMAAFLLTRELTPLLKRTAAHSDAGCARIIAVSSSAHRICSAMHWADLNLFDNYNPTMAYAQAKLANLLFTRELDRRLSPDGIVAQAMHPGQVDTNFASYGDELLQDHMSKAQLDQPDRPAQTLTWLATTEDTGGGGGYFHDMKEETPAPQALDDDAARRLWRESEALLEQAGV